MLFTSTVAKTKRQDLLLNVQNYLSVDNRCGHAALGEGFQLPG